MLEEWKRRAVHTFLEAVRPQGHVLAIGFDVPIAQATILERENDWEKAFAPLGTFDTILFHDISLKHEMQIHSRLNPLQAAATAAQAQLLLNSMAEQLAKITVRFSDQEIDAFYSEIGRFHQGMLPQFFERLKTQGNISEAQYVRVCACYLASPADALLQVLTHCLSHHMHQGSRFVCCAYASRYEDPQFFDQIISNQHLSYQEQVLTCQPQDLFCLSVVKEVACFSENG